MDHDSHTGVELSPWSLLQYVSSVLSRMFSSTFARKLAGSTPCNVFRTCSKSTYVLIYASFLSTNTALVKGNAGRTMVAFILALCLKVNA